MNAVGQLELATQRNVIAFFQEVLGYVYLGNWQDRTNNGNVERQLLSNWLAGQGHDARLLPRFCSN